MKVDELIQALAQYPADSEVILTTIVDTNKCDKEMQVGCKEGIYFVDATIVGVEVSPDDEDIPNILAHDDNYDGYCCDEGCECEQLY